MFERFNIYKDLYRKPHKHDCVARAVLAIQIDLILGSPSDCYVSDIRLKNYRLALFFYALSISVKIMFQKLIVFVFTKLII